MAIGIDPKVDFAFKKLLASRDHPEITIHFLNAVLSGDPVVKSVEVLNPFTEAAKLLEMISQTPDIRAIYQARLKLQRDELSRLEAAEARGEARGILRGKIQMLQSMLGEPESTIEELAKLGTEDLSRCSDRCRRGYTRGSRKDSGIKGGWYQMALRD
ncbi:MAG: PD-(D/E)XK nuclease family transposase [Planctomycetota bacterium]